MRFIIIFLCSLVLSGCYSGVGSVSPFERTQNAINAHRARDEARIKQILHEKCMFLLPDNTKYMKCRKSINDQALASIARKQQAARNQPYRRCYSTIIPSYGIATISTECYSR